METSSIFIFLVCDVHKNYKNIHYSFSRDVEELNFYVAPSG